MIKTEAFRWLCFEGLIATDKFTGILVKVSDISFVSVRDNVIVIVLNSGFERQITFDTPEKAYEHYVKIEHGLRQANEKKQHE